MIIMSKDKTPKNTKEVIIMFGIDIKIEVNKSLFRAFKYAVEKTYKRNVTEKKIAEIAIGAPVFHDGLNIVIEKRNGKIKLSDGTEYDFITATKEKLFTI